MTTFRLERRQVIPADRSAVFAFFQNPWNLEAITPPWLSFTVLAASDPVVREGTRIAYRLQWQVFPMRWESRITEYREGEYFADEMVRGPYHRWYHRHAFRDVAGGVEMRDEVEYALPLGCLGVLLHRMTIRGQLAAIFEYRALAIARRFPPPWNVSSRSDSCSNASQRSLLPSEAPTACGDGLEATAEDLAGK